MPPASRRPRALVIGGSLAGLCAANLLLRQGWDVEVFEQSAENLEGRGAGIITHPGLFDVLRAVGIPVDETIGVARRTKHASCRVFAPTPGTACTTRRYRPR